MVTHASIHVWRIPWTEKSDELQAMGSQSVRQDTTEACMYTGSLTVENYFGDLIILEIAKYKLKVLAYSVSGEIFTTGLHMASFSLCLSYRLSMVHGRKRESKLWSFFCFLQRH